VIDQLARRRLIAATHALEALGQIERFVAISRHAERTPKPCTFSKTRLARGGYRFPPDSG
jgi:hypothetical protein